jgi:hypothetical protein
MDQRHHHQAGVPAEQRTVVAALCTHRHGSRMRKVCRLLAVRQEVVLGHISHRCRGSPATGRDRQARHRRDHDKQQAASSKQQQQDNAGQ